MVFLSYGRRPSTLKTAKGGGDMHFLEVCRRWQAARNDIVMLTTDEGAELAGSDGISLETRIVKVPFNSRLYNSTLGAAISYLLRIAKALKYTCLPTSFDIVCAVSHALPDVVMASIISKRVRKSKPVVYLHHLIPNPRDRMQYHPWLASVLGWLSQTISLVLIKRFGFYIFTYQHMKEQLVNMGFPEEKIECITNGIDFTYARNNLMAKERFDACFLGRITPTKGVLDLVSIWKYVCNTLPNARLAIIGEGAAHYVEELTIRIREEKLENHMVLLGALSEDQKFALLRSSKLFVFPSFEEGWGIAICEAMACGLPVVAYDLPAYKAAFGGQALVAAPLGDTKKFADEVVILLQNEEKTKSLGKEAEIVVSKYDWDSIASCELGYLAKIAEGK